MPHKDPEMRRRWQKAYLEHKLKEDPDWRKRIQKRYRDKPENKIKAREYQRRKRKENPQVYRELQKNWRKRNPDKVKESWRKSRLKNLEKHREGVRNWHNNNREYEKKYRVKNQEKIKQRSLRYKKENSELIHQKDKQGREQRKILVIGEYSYYSYKCNCCGVSGIEFQTVDHENGRATMGHDRSVKGDKLYRLLIKQGFPPGYQVLCWNCNAAKGLYGKCPHQNS